MTRTLLLILAAITTMLGSFLWFVLTWDPEERAPMTFILDKKRMPTLTTSTPTSYAHGTAGGAMAQPSADPTGHAT